MLGGQTMPPFAPPPTPVATGLSPVVLCGAVDEHVYVFINRFTRKLNIRKRQFLSETQIPKFYLEVLSTTRRDYMYMIATFDRFHAVYC